MDSNVNAAIEMLRSCRKVYDAEHQYLSPGQREKGWSRYWSAIQVAMMNSGTMPQLGSSVPQKRNASTMGVGKEPASKRAGALVCTPVICVPLAFGLTEERHPWRPLLLQRPTLSNIHQPGLSLYDPACRSRQLF